MEILLHSFENKEASGSTFFWLEDGEIAFRTHDFGDNVGGCGGDEIEASYKLNKTDTASFLRLLDCEQKSLDEIKAVLLEKFSDWRLMWNIQVFCQDNKITLSKLSW